MNEYLGIPQTWLSTLRTTSPFPGFVFEYGFFFALPFLSMTSRVCCLSSSSLFLPLFLSSVCALCRGAIALAMPFPWGMGDGMDAGPSSSLIAVVDSNRWNDGAGWQKAQTNRGTGGAVRPKGRLDVLRSADRSIVAAVGIVEKSAGKVVKNQRRLCGL